MRQATVFLPFSSRNPLKIHPFLHFINHPSINQIMAQMITEAEKDAYCKPCHSEDDPILGDEEENEKENEHWWQVMRTLLHYSDFFDMELERRQRHLNKLNNIYIQRLPQMSFDKFRILQDKSIENQYFLEDMVDFHARNSFLAPPLSIMKLLSAEKQQSDIILPEKDVGPDADIRQQHRNQAVLHSVYREWSKEAAQERAQSFQPLIDALCQLKPVITEGEKQNLYQQRVLVPGCGLGRLPVEIASLGYCCEGNEYSSYMAIASNFVLNGITEKECYPLAPWIGNICNVKQVADTFATCNIPDATSMDILTRHYPFTYANDAGIPKFSMAAGNFMDIYGNEANANAWDAVVTCFFIDTAPVVMEYIDCIHHMLKPGGVWINLGPLLYHWVADVEANNDDRYNQSIELSYEEIKHVIETFGFQYELESFQQDVGYTRCSSSLMSTNYHTVTFAVRKPE